MARRLKRLSGEILMGVVRQSALPIGRKFAFVAEKDEEKALMSEQGVESRE
jgi:hypothetical protein